jgi:NAD(P)-dependent dehydrogenase (short-subunit alcohol dehydrogenase family)
MATWLITGCSTGLVRAFAEAALTRGHNVVATARDVAQVGDIADAYPGTALALPLDVTDDAQVTAAVTAAGDRFGGIDVLVNNAGVAQLEPVLEVTEEKWDTQLTVNLKAPFFLAQTVARAMVNTGRGGKIINVASTAGLIGVPEHAAYCASKGGLLALTRTLACELSPHGIQVNAICPAIVMTPMGRQVWDHPGVREEALEKIPAGRFGEEADVSAAIIYLASPASNWMTGSQLVLDGGLTATR